MLALSLCSLLWFAPSTQANDTTQLMEKLVHLRGEIETLSRDLEAENKNWQAQLDLWQQKRLELEGHWQRETLRELQLKEKTNRLTVRVQSGEKKDPKSHALWRQWIADAKAWVNTSLPMQTAQRLQRLDNLNERAESGLEGIETLSAELWQFYESELKMAGEIEYKMTDGPSGKKAETARLGVYALVTLDSDDQLHLIKKQGSEWKTLPLTEADSQTQARRLLQNVKGKRKAGLYDWPHLTEVSP